MKRGKVRKWSDKLAEAVFPTGIYCICCGSIIDESRTYAICDSCVEKVSWVRGKTCGKCGKMLAEESRKGLCRDCRERKHEFRRGYTCSQYDLYERAMIMDLKYRDKSYIGEKLGLAMADRLEMENRLAAAEGRIGVHPDIVIPVPLHEGRMEERGYNQAELIARPAAERLGAELDTGILFRKKKTPAMKDLGAVERRQNMQDAFGIREGAEKNAEGKNILVIDDIYTTGATLDACARVLYEAGASAVDVCTFAAGGDPKPSDG